MALNDKGIVYSINKTHNKHIASQYEEIGVRVATIDADTPESERKKIVNDFKIKFPTIEGFEITCMHWEKKGEEIEI